MLLTLAACIFVAAADAAEFPAAAAATFETSAEAVRAVLSEAMRCQGIRQLHVAAVHDGRLLFAHRLEARPEDGSVADIDRPSLLSLASVSKGMLGSALPRMQEELMKRGDGGAQVNLLKTPLKSIFGDDFWFLDQTRTDLVTIEDMVSHSTGLNRHDALWYLATIKSKEDLARLTGQLPAGLGFRSSFRYNNLVWTIVDLALQRITGKSYTDYMRDSLWGPLNMTETYGSSEMTDEMWDRVYSNSHSIVDGIPFESAILQNATNLVEAAGGIVTSLGDMVKYMQYLTRSNYSSVRPLPGQFGPVNAFAAENGHNLYFNRDLYTAPDTDFPDLEIESYSKGWFRTWYRNNLVYSHGGSLFGVRCELDVYLKRKLAVFTHTNLVGSSDAILQPLYAAILNKYLADMLLLNSSFVTQSNVCTLLHRVNTQAIPLARLNMTEADVSFCCGSFGSYGFGTVVIYWNRTSQAINAQYGILHIELVLIVTKDQYYQFLPLPVSPVNVSGVTVIKSNLTHILALNTSLHSHAYVKIYKKSDKIVLNYPALEQSLLLEKGLDPGTWQRPKPCDGNSLPWGTELPQDLQGSRGVSMARPGGRIVLLTLLLLQLAL